ARSTRHTVEPGAPREAGKAVQRAKRSRPRQDGAQRERLSPGVSLLRVQLLARPADDVARRDPRRARRNAVVARETGRERPLGDVAQLEATFHRVADQRDPPARGLPLDGIDNVCRTRGLTEGALV